MEPAPHFPRHGMLRIAALSPETAVANPRRNIAFMLSAMDQHGDADLLVYPELCITGYSCADLFACDDLLDAATAELQHLLEATRQKRQMICVGLPLLIQDALMNVAILICRGRPIAVVPKRYLPTYKEFYEGRWFRAGDADMPQTVSLCGHDVPCGIDVLVKCGDALIGMEICEDLWTPNPPSSAMAMAGANVLVNLSASNETIGKSQWRRDLVSSQSGRCIAAYAYASCGPTESSTDLVFSGDCMIGENGRILDRSDRVEDWMDGTENDRSTMRSCAVADIDLQRLTHDRRVTSSFDDGRVDLPHAYRIVDVDPSLVFATETRSPLRSIDPHPFVPESHEDLQERCREVFSVQAAGLAKRVSCLPKSVPLMIGVSGGLDSTLALLVAVKTMDRIGDDRGRIHGITMPGFGTTQRTRSNADDLMQHLGIRNETIDIRPLALQSFRDLGHAPLGIPINHETTAESLQQQLIDTANELRSEGRPVGDLVLENVQARLRTFLLMSRGFVLGTGDMSEQALGWSTYNGDHMSMYNVNTSIPKTLVRFLVRYGADALFAGDDQATLRQTLLAIADTPISPELLPPGDDDQIAQNTETSVGPYELHDFFLFHTIRNGFSTAKILWLASHTTFDEPYSESQIRETLTRFQQRFARNQFKRSCVPDGPKVGSVSLSPRGDWRMPSDADGWPRTN